MDHEERKKSKYCDIGYNFLIGGDGSIYEGKCELFKTSTDVLRPAEKRL